MTRIVMIFITLLISVMSFSQKSIYIIAGTTNGIENSTFSNTGFNAGVQFDIPIKGNWSYQIGLNYNLIYEESNMDVIHYIGNQNILFDEGYISKYNYMEIPSIISYKLKIGSQIIFRVNYGLFFGVFAGGTSLLRSSKGFSDYSLVELTAYPVHLGFCVGAGVELRNIYLGIEGNTNITDAYLSDGIIKTKLGMRF